MKPPVPHVPGASWERVEIDTSDDSPFEQARRIAVSAAAAWDLSEEGPYAKPEMSLADATAGAVREALLHLLELGLIDLDVERIDSLDWWPANRRHHNARSNR